MNKINVYKTSEVKICKIAIKIFKTNITNQTLFYYLCLLQTKLVYLLRYILNYSLVYLNYGNKESWFTRKNNQISLIRIAKAGYSNH